MKKDSNYFLDQFCSGKIDRRSFLKKMGALGLTLAAGNLLACFNSRSFLKFNSPESQILKEVQNHIFPKNKDVPGAEDVNAFEYLQIVLLDETLDIRDRKYLINGGIWLEEEVQKKYDKSFVELKSSEKEVILKEISNTRWGKRWLSSLLNYIFEALLADPIYAVNTNSIGWKWLGHKPGYPRPKEIFSELL